MKKLIYLCLMVFLMAQTSLAAEIKAYRAVFSHYRASTIPAMEDVEEIDEFDIELKGPISYDGDLYFILCKSENMDLSLNYSNVALNFYEYNIGPNGNILSVVSGKHFYSNGNFTLFDNYDLRFKTIIADRAAYFLGTSAYEARSKIHAICKFSGVSVNGLIDRRRMRNYHIAFHGLSSLENELDVQATPVWKYATIETIGYMGEEKGAGFIAPGIDPILVFSNYSEERNDGINYNIVYRPHWEGYKFHRDTLIIKAIQISEREPIVSITVSEENDRIRSIIDKVCGLKVWKEVEVTYDLTSDGYLSRAKGISLNNNSITPKLDTTFLRLLRDTAGN